MISANNDTVLSGHLFVYKSQEYKIYDDFITVIDVGNISYTYTPLIKHLRFNLSLII